jgi:hypothetical protein
MIENGVIFFDKASQAVHGFASLGYARSAAIDMRAGLALGA